MEVPPGACSATWLGAGWGRALRIRRAAGREGGAGGAWRRRGRPRLARQLSWAGRAACHSLRGMGSPGPSALTGTSLEPRSTLSPVLCPPTPSPAWQLSGQQLPVCLFLHPPQVRTGQERSPDPVPSGVGPYHGGSLRGPLTQSTPPGHLVPFPSGHVKCITDFASIL